MSDEIINRVAKSGLVELDLAELIPTPNIVELDIKSALYHEMVLKEKDFRDFVKDTDFAALHGDVIAVHCSVDAIIPTWAYMLIASRCAENNKQAFFGTVSQAEESYYFQIISAMNLDPYVDKRVVMKGCANVSQSAFFQLTQRLTPVVASLMFGEPCSTVPVYKRPKNKA